MRVSSIFFRLLPLLVLLPVAHAQESRGKILGRISDSSGAVIPRAAVSAIHTEMNTRTPAQTNDAGNYELPYLIPGVYRVVVEASGFKRLTREPIEVRVGDSITLDLTLEIGSVNESIVVTAEAPLLEASSASLSNTFDRRMLEDLPIIGANTMSLARMTPGVTTAQAPGHNYLASATDVMSNINVAGNSNTTNEFSLDGIPNMSRARASFSPPSDMVQEFRVESVSYDASLGHAGGGSINLSLKAGTNKLHATANYDYAPNPWQATNFFTNKQLYDLSTGPVTPEKRAKLVPPRTMHRYSGTIGGPVVIPKLYNGRDKTFWMYGYQGFNRRSPVYGVGTVPSPSHLKGDFSDLLNVGSVYQIYDPATIVPAPGGRFRRSPFPGNIIPSARLYQASLKVAGYFKPANTAGTADGRNNYQVTYPNSNDFRQNMGRVDHVFNDRHRIFGRFTQSWLNFYRNDWFQNEARGLDRYRLQRGFGFDDVYMVSPSFLVNFKYGFTRYVETDNAFSRGMDLSAFGFPASLTSQIDNSIASFPVYAIDQYITLGETTNYLWTTNYHTWSAVATQTTGSHSIRYGGEFRLYRDHNYSYGNVAPNQSFGATYTRGPLDNSPVAPIGQGLASFLLGIPTGGSIDRNASSAAQSTYTGLFIADDWKVTSKLMLNIGFRWEFETPTTERYDRAVRGYDFVTPNPISAAALASYAKSPIPELPVSQFRTTGGLTFVNLNGQPRGILNTRKSNFAPRIGLAWQVFPKTVIRAGYGIFVQPIGVDRINVNQSGFSQRTNLISSVDNGQTYIASITNPFPNGILEPSPVGLTTFLGRSVSFLPGELSNPYMQRWSFSLQREFAGRILGEVAYVGNRATRLGASQPYDATPRNLLSTSPERDDATNNYLSAQVTNPFYGMPEFAGSGIAGRTMSRASLLTPYPHMNGMTGTEPIGFSWYHSLQARMDKRFNRGFSINLTYTWSKAMEATSYLNDTDPALHHVISSIDRPHRFTMSGIWELPFGRGKAVGSSMPKALDYAVGGWQLQAIWQLQSGPPLGFGNIIYRGDIHDIVLPRGERTVERWFNTSAPFEKSAAKQLVSNIRTFPLRLTGLRGPGDDHWDASLSKTFTIGENLRIQARTMWEGAMNHPLFSTPNMAPTNTLFGAITATRGEGRRILIGARVLF